MFEYVVIGAGFSGAVVAREIATRLNKKVLLIEKRHHIGGNCYDYLNEHGIFVHKYGPHLFHTDNNEIVKLDNKFGRELELNEIRKQLRKEVANSFGVANEVMGDTDKTNKNNDETRISISVFNGSKIDNDIDMAVRVNPIIQMVTFRYVFDISILLSQSLTNCFNSALLNSLNKISF